MPSARTLLQELYRRLDGAYGDQQWWPGETPFEVAVGAILTQNTAWSNVEKAIANLKAAGLLEPKRLAEAPPARVAALIKPSGYYNVKARRLNAFLRFLDQECGGRVEGLTAWEQGEARRRLLGVAGIGPETADSILLYAGGFATFVVDAYTHRVFFRHNLVDRDASYEELKSLCEDNLPADAKLFNQFHALLVRVGKERCRKSRPECEGCPLEGFNGVRRWEKEE